MPIKQLPALGRLHDLATRLIAKINEVSGSVENFPSKDVCMDMGICSASVIHFHGNNEKRTVTALSLLTHDQQYFVEVAWCISAWYVTFRTVSPRKETDTGMLASVVRVERSYVTQDAVSCMIEDIIDFFQTKSLKGDQDVDPPSAAS